MCLKPTLLPFAELTSIFYPIQTISVHQFRLLMLWIDDEIPQSQAIYVEKWVFLGQYVSSSFAYTKNKPQSTQISAF